VSPTRLDSFPGWPSAAITLAGFVWLLAPGSSWYDAGELAATAAHLGVPHPTGFPVFNLSGHLFTLLPIGPLAWRVHLMGAVAAVAATWLWLGVLRDEAQNPIDSGRGLAWLTGAAAIGLPLLAPACLQHVRAAEIYPLAWLAVAAGLAVFVRALPAWRPAALLVLAALAGSIHIEAAMIIGLLAVFAVAEVAVAPRWRRAAASLPMLVVAGLLALAAVAYLPLAAGRLPAFSWGDLRSVDALWGHLSAASIREAYATRMGTIGLDGAATLFLDQLRDNVGLLALPALLGVALSWRHHRRALVASVAVICIDAAYSLLLNPMGLRDQQVGLLTFLGAGVLAVQGLLGVVAMVANSARVSPLVASLLGTALLVGIAGQTLGETSRQAPNVDLEAGARMADTLLKDAPPGSLLITSGDHAGSACAWMQAGEGERPDSPCVPGVFLRDETMLRLLAARTGERGMAEAAQLIAAGEQRSEVVLSAWMRPAVAARPVRWELGLAAEERHLSGHLLPGFPWHTLSDERISRHDRERAYKNVLEGLLAQCNDAPPAACRPESPLASWLAHHAAVVAARAMASGHVASAGPLLRAAVSWAPRQPKILNNLAVYLLGRRQPKTALAACQRALAARPDYLRAHRTAARAALLAGQDEAALDHARAWLAGQPASASQRRWLHGLAEYARAPETAADLRALLPSLAGVSGADAPAQR